MHVYAVQADALSMHVYAVQANALSMHVYAVQADALHCLFCVWFFDSSLNFFFKNIYIFWGRGCSN